MQETLTDKLVRLAYGDAQHREEVAALATAEFYGQFSYEPVVGPEPNGKRGSAGRAPKPTPLDELVSDERAEAARARAAEEAEEEWKQSHTFQPSLDAVSKRLAELSQPSRAVRYSEPEQLLQAIQSERCAILHIVTAAAAAALALACLPSYSRVELPCWLSGLPTPGLPVFTPQTCVRVHGTESERNDGLSSPDHRWNTKL
jgi:hypothetical protein